MPLEIKINPVGSIEVEEGRFYVSIGKNIEKHCGNCKDSATLMSSGGEPSLIRRNSETP